MVNQARYSYRLDNAFLKSVSVRRESKLPSHFELPIAAHINVRIENASRRVQIELKVESPADCPVPLVIEAVGLFDLLEGATVPEHTEILSFINDQAIHMLWPYAAIAVADITAHMGMQPLKIRTPYLYALEDLAAVSDASEEEE